MQDLNNIIVELSELKVHTGIGYKLNIPDNYVIYFEKEQNKELNIYIKENHDEIKAKFQAIGLNFIYLPCIKVSKIM